MSRYPDLRLDRFYHNASPESLSNANARCQQNKNRDPGKAVGSREKATIALAGGVIPSFRLRHPKYSTVFAGFTAQRRSETAFSAKCAVPLVVSDFYHFHFLMLL